MGKFFGSSCRESYTPPFKQVLTFLLCPEELENGVQMVSKCVETSLDSLQFVHFQDFSIGELLKHGINPKALNNTADRRLGSDAEVNAFIEKVDEISDQLFNVQN